MWNPNLGFVEPAPPGEDKVPPPDHESFQTSTNSTSLGRKRWSPESIASRTVWKPRFVGLATPGEDKVQSSDGKSFYTSTTPTYRGRTWCPPGQYRPARCGNPNLGFVEPASSATRAGYGPIPGSAIFHVSTTPTNRGRQRWSSRSIPPRTVWKPQPHWLIADWLGFVKPPAPGEYTIPSSEQNAFLTSTTPVNRGRKRLSPRTTPPRTVWKPQLRVHHC